MVDAPERRLAWALIAAWLAEDEEAARLLIVESSEICLLELVLVLAQIAGSAMSANRDFYGGAAGVLQAIRHRLASTVNEE